VPSTKASARSRCVPTDASSCHYPALSTLRPRRTASAYLGWAARQRIAKAQFLVCSSKLLSLEAGPFIRLGEGPITSCKRMWTCGLPVTLALEARRDVSANVETARTSNQSTSFSSLGESDEASNSIAALGCASAFCRARSAASLREFLGRVGSAPMLSTEYGLPGTGAVLIFRDGAGLPVIVMGTGCASRPIFTRAKKKAPPDTAGGGLEVGRATSERGRLWDWGSDC